MCSAREQRGSLLEEGSTCWRVTRAARVALLIDGAAYFDALRRALPLARRSIDIVGWDIRSDISLDPLGDAQPLRKFLRGLLAERPTLRIRILVWDWTVFFSLDREPLPQLQFGVAQTRRLDLVLDANHPAAACHHEKIVVVDGRLAFCGGIDLTAGRWDRPEHHPREPARGQIGRTPRPPFHDCMLMVEGEPARASTNMCASAGIEPPASAWSRRGRPAPVAVAGWRGGVVRAVPVAIARTRPAWAEQRAAREIEALYLRAIGAARRCIYIENQYLTVLPIADALAARLAERDGPEVVIVWPQAVRRLHRDRRDGSRPRLCLDRLRGADAVDRLRVLHPVSTRTTGSSTPDQRAQQADDRRRPAAGRRLGQSGEPLDGLWTPSAILRSRRRSVRARSGAAGPRYAARRASRVRRRPPSRRARARSAPWSRRSTR